MNKETTILQKKRCVPQYIIVFHNASRKANNVDKNITFFKVLEALQTEKECALCKLEADAIHAYFDAIMYEAVNDPKVRLELAKAHGYCHRHAHFLFELRDSLGVAILYQDQVKLFMDLFAKKGADELNRNQQRYNIDGACPACRNQVETRCRYVNTLIEGWHEPEIKSAYEAAAGFCVPHLAILLETVKDTVISDQLFAIERNHLTGLWDELQEFIRKHDYRYSDEPYGPESNSWIRAIRKLTGAKEVF
jgi:hypothetical protein